LAAVAVTGGAFAQATMTGAIAFGYQSDTSSAGALSSGMGMDDAEINFAVAEDIEGVGKLSAGLGFGSGGNADAATGNDSTIKLTTASGASITMGTTKGASYLTQGLASAGTAYQWNLSGRLFGARTKNDSVSVKFPVMEGTSVSFAHAEDKNTSSADYWTGTGAAGSGTDQRYNTLSLDYAAGALAVNVGYRSYDNGIASSESSKNNRNRASASYDLGVAKIGGGYESTSYMYGNTATDTLVSVNVPLSSALNVGAQFGQTSTSGGTTNESQSGNLLVANYTLSKRTYLVGNYYSYSVSGGTQNASGYGLFLYNTF
jgi:hypothetical protein